MDFENIEMIKEGVNALMRICDFMQEYGYYESLSDKMSFSDILHIEFTKFISYIISSDGHLSDEEVEIYKYITGYDFSYQDLKEIIEDSEVLTQKYKTEIPLLMKIMVSACNSFFLADNDLDDKEEYISNVYSILLKTYLYIGMEVAKADNYISYAEKRDVIRYAENIKCYVSDHSFLNVDSSLQEIIDRFDDAY